MRTKTMIMAILCLLLVQASVLAQEESEQTVEMSGVLIYETETDGQVAYVRHSAGQRDAFVIPPDQCAAITDDGTSVAVAGRDAGLLRVIELESQAVLLEVPWDDAWERCAFGWRSATQLVLPPVDRAAQAAILTLPEGVIVPADTLPVADVVWPDLPHWVPGTFRLASPDRTRVFYEYCPDAMADGETWESKTECFEPPTYRVYDPETRETVFETNDVSQVYLPIRLGPDPESYASVSWSPDGRYIAYISAQYTLEPVLPVRVIDVESRAFMPGSRPYYDIAVFNGLNWSPDSSVVAFWTIFQDHQGITVYDIGEERFIEAEWDMPIPNLRGNWWWSPDSQYFAYISSDGDLRVRPYADWYGLNVTLDTNVARVIAWREEG
jgi:hypothetical protein